MTKYGGKKFYRTLQRIQHPTGTRRPKAVAVKVERITKIVNRMKPETKYSDLDIVGQTFNWTPTSAYVQNIFSPLAQGSTDFNKYIGDEIYVKNFRLKGLMYNTTTSYLNYRIVVIKVRHNMENLLTTTNLGNLVMESAYSSTANALHAPLDHDNRHGVTVLYDRRFTLNPNLSSATTSNQTKLHNINLNLNCKVSFAAGNAIPTKNGVYIFFISDSSSQGYFNYIARTSYTDV